jgi:hypothetical protein
LETLSIVAKSPVGHEPQHPFGAYLASREPQAFGGNEWQQVGERVAELLGDPRYMHGVAYGFRSDSDILPVDCRKKVAAREASIGPLCIHTCEPA